MSKKLMMFVSAAVLSFGMALSAGDVVAPVTNSQEFVVAQSISAVIQELEAQGISRDEILAAVGADKNISAKDWSAIQAFITNNGNAFAGSEIGSITIGQIALTLAVVAAVYYGAPRAKNLAVAGWEKGAALAGSIGSKKKSSNPVEAEIVKQD